MKKLFSIIKFLYHLWVTSNGFNLYANFRNTFGIDWNWSMPADELFFYFYSYWGTQEFLDLLLVYLVCYLFLVICRWLKTKYHSCLESICRWLQDKIDKAVEKQINKNNNISS